MRTFCLIMAIFLFAGCEDQTQLENKIEKEIDSYELSEERKNSKALAIINPSGKGVCIKKTKNMPLIEINLKGKAIKAKTEICGPIATNKEIYVGDTYYVYDQLISLNYFFIETLKEDMPDLDLKEGDNMCIAVEKLSHLPEYGTKGPWFLIPKCHKGI